MASATRMNCRPGSAGRIVPRPCCPGHWCAGGCLGRTGGGGAGSETIARALRAAERHPRVRAIVFHVDSGGGSALASDLIWREVDRIKSRKPVVAFMGNVAGSGGYYVSCGASRIVAQPTTITGSIGVVTGKLTVRGLYERLGAHRRGGGLASAGSSTTGGTSPWRYSGRANSPGFPRRRR